MVLRMTTKRCDCASHNNGIWQNDIYIITYMYKDLDGEKLVIELDKHTTLCDHQKDYIIKTVEKGKFDEETKRPKEDSGGDT